MCDYSLEIVASRPAMVGDKLISTSFPHTITRGFASADDRNIAVCLLPGTELPWDSVPDCALPARKPFQARSCAREKGSGRNEKAMLAPLLFRRHRHRLLE